MRLDDRGAAAVWAAFLVVGLVAAAGFVTTVGSLAVTRSRVATVADLAAVAGAMTGACASAADVVERNGMRLVSCDEGDGDMVVRVAAAAPMPAQRVLTWLGRTSAEVEAAARAGYG